MTSCDWNKKSMTALGWHLRLISWTFSGQQLLIVECFLYLHQWIWLSQSPISSCIQAHTRWRGADVQEHTHTHSHLPPYHHSHKFVAWDSMCEIVSGTNYTDQIQHNANMFVSACVFICVCVCVYVCFCVCEQKWTHSTVYHHHSSGSLLS